MAFACPKCQSEMRTYERAGVHIEQCTNCRGIFLDYGELEHLSQLEARMMQPPPQAGPPPQAYPPQGYPPQAYPPQGYPPAWGAPHHKKHKGLGRMLFST